MEVYVGTYRLYNKGYLKGHWVDVTGFKSQEEFMKHCREIFKDNDLDPEIMIQDSIGIPKEYVSETEISKDFFEIYLGVLKTSDKEIVDAFIELGYKEFINKINDYYMGEYDNDEEFAEEILSEELEAIHWCICVDIERTARNLMQNYCTLNTYYFSCP